MKRTEYENIARGLSRLAEEPDILIADHGSGIDVTEICGVPVVHTHISGYPDGWPPVVPAWYDTTLDVPTEVAKFCRGWQG